MFYKFFGRYKDVPMYFTEENDVYNIAKAGLLDNGLQVIIVNQLFFDLFNKHEQEFMLNHEYGHIILDHLPRLNSFGKNPPIELVELTEVQADLYAVQNTKNGKKALEEICAKMKDTERMKKVESYKFDQKTKVKLMKKKVLNVLGF